MDLSHARMPGKSDSIYGKFYALLRIWSTLKNLGQIQPDLPNLGIIKLACYSADFGPNSAHSEKAFPKG